MKKPFVALLALALTPSFTAAFVPAAAAADPLPPIRSILPYPGPHGYIYKTLTIVDHETGGVIESPLYLDPDNGQPRLEDGQTRFIKSPTSTAPVTVNQDGSLTVAPLTPVGTYSVNIRYVRSDGVDEVTTARFAVQEKKNQANSHSVVARPVTYPSAVHVLVVEPDDRPVDPSLIQFVGVGVGYEQKAGYSVNVSDNGEVTLKAPEQREETTIEVPIRVIFQDSSEKTTTAVFKVPAASAPAADPKSDPQTDPKPDPKPEPQTDPKSDPKPDLKPDSKPVGSSQVLNLPQGGMEITISAIVIGVLVSLASLFGAFANLFF